MTSENRVSVLSMFEQGGIYLTNTEIILGKYMATYILSINTRGIRYMVGDYLVIASTDHEAKTTSKTIQRSFLYFFLFDLNLNLKEYQNIPVII